MAYCILKSYKLKVQPHRIFEVLRRHKNCFFLDSSLNSSSLGRYSFLGIEPFLILQSKGQDLSPKLRNILDSYRLAVPKGSLPFLAGAVGYLAYDLGFVLEKKLARRPKPQAGIPDCFFGFYNTSVIIDHLKRRLHICAVGFPEKKDSAGRLLAEKNFKKMHRLLSSLNADSRGLSRQSIFNEGGIPPSSLVRLAGHSDSRRCFYLRRSALDSRESALKLQVNSNFSQNEYIAAVRKAKEYIKKGDIYQVNLSQEFSLKTSLSAEQIYQRLRNFSPSCFSAYFDAGDFQILSSSPERFLKLDGNIVSTRPMKGTRPRGKNKARDRGLKEELLKSAKDKAELMMIVDLERNDLGRVCDYDSIRVQKLRQIEEYKTVFQTTATVCGRLHPEKDRIDLLRACFPGGSITGCPKIRSMEIIEELEPGRRNVYTGCLGYLSFGRDMDFNILIRTMLKKDDQLYFGVGGGVVADSDPQLEYEETLVKARGMMQAINAL